MSDDDRPRTTAGSETATTGDETATTAGNITATDGGTATTDNGATATDGRGRLRRNARLFYTLLKKELIITVRYPINLVSLLVTTFLFFVLLLEGGRRFGGPQFDGSVGGLVVGYLVFTLSVSAYQSLAQSIQTEAGWGTLERLQMSPLGFGRIMLYQSFVRVLVSFLWTALIIPPVLLVSGESLRFDPLTVVPVAMLGISSIVGIGLLVGGASVLYKRVSNVFQLFQFGLIPLIAAPIGELPWLRVFPVVQSNVMLGRAMRNGVRLWEFPIEAHATLVAVAVGYLAVGYAGFMLFVRRARRLGVMGDY